MTFTEAMIYISEVQEQHNEPLLETLQRMDRSLFDYTDQQRTAFRVVMNDFRKLFATSV